MKNLLGRTYIVKQYGRNHRWTYDFLKDALAFAKISAAIGGDWTITRVNKNGTTKVLWKSSLCTH